MSPNTTQILTSPYLLYTTSIFSFIIARFIITQVQKHGPIPIFRSLIKHNSRIYALFSILHFLTILISFSHQPPLTLHNLICVSPPQTPYENMLRYVYHASKFYEYVDIFNVLAVGGVVNAHFGFHHFTVWSHFLRSFYAVQYSFVLTQLSANKNQIREQFVTESHRHHT